MASTTNLTLPQYYGYKEVLDAYGGEIPFTEAWVQGTIPFPVRVVVLDTMPPRHLEVLLLARMCRQLDALAQLLQAGEVTVFETPQRVLP
jgi:hypothetical protein